MYFETCVFYIKYIIFLKTIVFSNKKLFLLVSLT